MSTTAHTTWPGWRLWTVDGLPATSRTLFVRHAVPWDTVVPLAEAEPPVMMVTQRVPLDPDDPQPDAEPRPDHAHVAPQLLVEPGAPARIVPGYRFRLREIDGGWRFQGAQYARWHPGRPVAAADGLVMDQGVDYVLTHRDGDPCGIEVVAVARL